jgi:hypothetical protein
MPVSPVRDRVLLVALAGGLVAAQAGIAALAPGLTHETASTIRSVVPLILLLSLPALAGLVVARRLGTIRPGRLGLAVMILAGLAMRGVHLAAAPVIEDDFFRYLWDGALVAHGLDPYRLSPGEVMAGEGGAAVQRLAAEAGAILPRINFPELRTIYPGTAQAAFALAHLLAPWQLPGLRLVMLAAELATLALMLAALARLGRSPLWAGLYWLNPLVVLVLANQAHAEALLPPLLLGAMMAAARDRPGLAGVCLGLAAGVKLWPLALAPLIMRGWIARPGALAAAVLGLALAAGATLTPLILTAFGEKAGLSAYAGSWANNNAPFAWVLHGLRLALPQGWPVEALLRAAIAATAAAVALGAAVRRPAGFEGLLAGALVVAAAMFYLSPAQFPWYAVWFLPLAALAGSGPLLAASIALPAYYLFFPLAWQGRFDAFQYGVAAIHPLAVLVWIAVAGPAPFPDRSRAEGSRAEARP